MNKPLQVFLLVLAAGAWLSGLDTAPTGADHTGSDNPFKSPTRLLAPTKKGSTRPGSAPRDADQVNTCYESGQARLKEGDFAGALVEFDRLVALRPYSAAAFTARSRARESLKDYDGAIADESRVIELDPGNPASYQRRAVCEMLVRRWNEASEDLRAACEKPGIKNPYSFLFRWLVHTHSGEKAAADEELAAYLDAPPSFDAPDEWVRHVGRFLLGREAEADFLAAAAPVDPGVARQTRELWPLMAKPLLQTPKPVPIDSGQHCEAWFYCGVQRVLAGDKAGGADAFQRCLATKRTTFVEYRLAGAELEALAR